jgi:hypothetical protein
VFLGDLVKTGADLILIDLTIVNECQENLVFLQHVPKKIYEATYPVFSLSEAQLKDVLAKGGYNHLLTFSSMDFPELKKINASFRGYIYKRSN